MNVRMAILAGGILSLAVVATALVGPEPLAGQSGQEPVFGSERQIYAESPSVHQQSQPPAFGSVQDLYNERSDTVQQPTQPQPAARPQFFLPEGQQRSIYTAAGQGTNAGQIQQVQQVQQYQPQQQQYQAQPRQQYQPQQRYQPRQQPQYQPRQQYQPQQQPQQYQGQQQVAAQPQQQPQETEIQRQLRMLYNKGGQRMPEMNMNRLGNPNQQQRISAQGRDISRKSPGRATMPQQPQPRVQQPRVQQTSSGLSFLNKLNPFAKDDKPKQQQPSNYRLRRKPYQPKVYRNSNYGRHSNRRTQPVAQNPQLQRVPQQQQQPQYQPRQTQYVAQPQQRRQRVAPTPPQYPYTAQPPANNRQPNTVRNTQPPMQQRSNQNAGSQQFQAKPSKEEDIPVLFDEKSTPQKQVSPPPRQTQPVVRQPRLGTGTANPFPGVASPKGSQPAPKTSPMPGPMFTENPPPPTNPVIKKQVKAPQPPVETKKPQPKTGGSTVNPFENIGTKNDPENPFAAPGKPATKKPEPKKKEDNPFVKTKKPQGPPPKLKIYSAQDIRKRFKPTRASVKKEKETEYKPRVKNDKPKQNSHADKMRRIVARRGLAGFRGFCPVVLRDRRSLADGKPEHHAKFEGRTYFFSSAGSRTVFLRSPKKYAPAKMGLDVVRMAEGGESVEGSLEHAAWYKDRLYFFTSATTLRIFVKSPQKYLQ